MKFENGREATCSETQVIAHVEAAAKLFMSAASGRQTKLTTSPPAPTRTIHFAHTNTTMFATRPPGVKRPNACAMIGTPAAQAEHETPKSPAHFRQRLPASNHGSKWRDQWHQNTMPNMTANESAQPRSKRRSGA